MFFLLAVSLDSINVKGFTAYSLVDGIDWTSGYAERFGLYNVDFADDAKTRSPTKAAATYR